MELEIFPDPSSRDISTCLCKVSQILRKLNNVSKLSSALLYMETVLKIAKYRSFLKQEEERRNAREA